MYNPSYLCHITPADTVANGRSGCKGRLLGGSLSCDGQAQKENRLISQSPAQPSSRNSGTFPATCSVSKRKSLPWGQLCLQSVQQDPAERREKLRPAVFH